MNVDKSTKDGGFDSLKRIANLNEQNIYIVAK